GPDPGRLRVHARVPRGAHDARREDHPDLRGHESDPAGRHRPPAAQADHGVTSASESERRRPWGACYQPPEVDATDLAPRPAAASAVTLSQQMDLIDANLLGT